ncbi:hypothetical protein B0H19DRAFT_1382419 [Mycena capillaripes]|nr:hypothetical protein B0H19DRAFT_1382419 [Mycena capillaripes]
MNARSLLLPPPCGPVSLKSTPKWKSSTYDSTSLREPIFEALESIVYPILTLPPEITAEIFQQHFNGLHSVDDDRWRVDLHTASRAGPLFLAQVCKAWLTIALSMLFMWSRIRVFSSEQTLPGKQKLLQCWLPRAGDHPLYLDIMGYLDCRQSELLFPTLASYSAQWRTFSCYLQTPISFPINQVQGHVPLLRKLRLGLKEASRAAALITAFSDAPQLREVELLYLPPTWISLPWAQLTRLVCFGQNIEQCAEVLSHTANLERLSVDLKGFTRGVQPTPVRLDNLHTLEIMDSFERTLKVLPYLTLPALRHLHATLPSDAPSLAPLRTLLARSGCTLHSISLYSNSTFAIPCLAALGTASEVSLPTLNWASSDLAALFDRIATDPTFLPHIRSLSLLRCETTIPYVEMCDMLVARWYERGSKPKLDSFRLVRGAGDSDQPPDPATSEKLWAMVDEGLNIHIESLHKSERSYQLEFNNF